MRKVRFWTDEEKQYFKEITPGHHYKEIQLLMKEKFDLELSLSQIKGAVGRYKLNTGFNGQIQKGHTPFNKSKKGLTTANKTSFKKGNIPKNYMPIGTQRVNGDDYIDIKIADPNVWKGKHILIWEEHNGPVPPGYAVIFGDKNNRNFDIDNLILVSRQQLLVLNRYKLIQNDADLTRTAVIIANLHQKISERKRG